jgi:hypothetical protein
MVFLTQHVEVVVKHTLVIFRIVNSNLILISIDIIRISLSRNLPLASSILPKVKHPSILISRRIRKAQLWFLITRTPRSLLLTSHHTNPSIPQEKELHLVLNPIPEVSVNYVYYLKLLTLTLTLLLMHNFYLEIIESK